MYVQHAQKIVGIWVFAPFPTGELIAFHRPSSWIKMKNVPHILVTSSCQENVVLVWCSLQRQNLASATNHKSSYFFSEPSKCWATGYFM